MAGILGAPLDPNLLNQLLTQVGTEGHRIGEGYEADVRRLGDWVVKTLKPGQHLPAIGASPSAFHQSAPLSHTASQVTKAQQLRFVPPTTMVPPNEQSTLTKLIQPFIKPSPKLPETSVGLRDTRQRKLLQAMQKLAAQKGISLRDLPANVQIGRLPGSKALRALLSDIGSIEPSVATQLIPQKLLNQMLQMIQGPQG